MIKGEKMSKQLVKQSQKLIGEKLEQLLIRGDLSTLTEAERIKYVNQLCKITGVSILTRPFDFIKLQDGKIMIYANRSCTEQLRKKHKISIKITAREKQGDLYVVTADAIDKSKREDSAIGAVNLAGLRGDALANAVMKAETKAKRRATLSLCGLGMLDELEAKEMVEREAKEQALEAVEAVQEKVAESEERPEFESVQTPAAPESQIASETPTSGDYILLAGKIKGKRLKSVPLKKLTDWLAWYEDWKNKGNQNDDIDSDAVHISQFLIETQTVRIES